MSIYITGDTHGDIDLKKLTTKYFDARALGLTKNDYVIILGDVACIWDGANQDRYLQKWFEDKPWTTLFIEGNHENFNLLDSYPIEEWHGGKVHRINNSIFHLMRGQVFTIENHTFFTMGGAESHDKIYRKEGVSWWAREMPSNDEYEEGLTNLNKVNNRVDYILSHCAPDQLLAQIAYWYKHDKLTNYLEIIRQTVEFKDWFLGHYHIDKDFDKYHILYQNIIEIKN